MNTDILDARLKLLTLIASSAAAARDQLARAMALKAQAESIPAISAPDPEVVGIIRSNGHSNGRRLMEAAARPSVGDPASAKAVMEDQANRIMREVIGELHNTLAMAQTLGNVAPITPQEMAFLRGG